MPYLNNCNKYSYVSSSNIKKGVNIFQLQKEKSRKSIFESIFIDKRQLMLEIGHHMFMVIVMAMKLIIISFERR